MKLATRCLSSLLLALLSGISIAVLTGFFVENYHGLDYGEAIWAADAHAYGYPVYWRVVWIPTNQVIRLEWLSLTVDIIFWAALFFVGIILLRELLRKYKR